MVRGRPGAGNTGAVFLFDRSKYIGYNMFNKGADTIVYTYPFPAQ